MFKNKWKSLQSQEREGNFTHSYTDLIPLELATSDDELVRKVAKLTYDELQSYLYNNNFPIIHDDNLYDTLGIDANEVDDIIEAILKSIFGGKFEFCGNDRRIPRMSTAGDLVSFLTSSVESGLFKRAR